MLSMVNLKILHRIWPISNKLVTWINPSRVSFAVGQNLFFENLLWSFISLSSFPLPFFFTAISVAHFITLTFLCMEIWLANFPGKQRVVGEKQNWQWTFPQMLTVFYCVSVRTGQNIEQLLDKVEQNIVIFQWRAELINYLPKPKAKANNLSARYFAITEFNNFIFWSLRLFLIKNFRKREARCLTGVMTEVEWFPSHFGNFSFDLKF